MLHARPFASVALAAVLVAVAGCGTTAAPSAGAAQPSESGGKVVKGGKKITLEATGKTATAAITYTFADKTGNKNNAKLPWKMEGDHTGSAEAVYLVTVTGDESGGNVGCRILVDGKVAKTGKGEGQFASADCTLYGFDLS